MTIIRAASYRFDKAMQLARKLELMLGTPRKGSDWLGEYRKWLDVNGIPVESDGYPSTEAHNDHNINLFVRQKRGIAA